MKRWKCIVCKYIHEGDTPPDTCPICKVPKEKFTEIDQYGNPIENRPLEKKPRKKVKPKPAPSGNALSRTLVKYHAHPMSVHVPNGVIPISAAFAFGAVFLNFAGWAQVAFYNNIVVLISLPFVLFSGYLSWKIKYRGFLSSRFITKIVSSTIATLAAAALVIWYYRNPQVLDQDSFYKWLFLAVNIILFGATSVSGFVGGKLVFKE
jgi:uncharacterized membrane protein